MNECFRLVQIRENERKSHTAMYLSAEQNQQIHWLNRPVKTITELFPYFASFEGIHVLDLGCGVGRNCIPIAQQFRNMSCTIDCVDILELAVEKLTKKAEHLGLSSSIKTYVKPIEDYSIPPNYYDWIIAVSALEHVDSRESFQKKLIEIENGIRIGGIVTFVINSGIKEFEKATMLPSPVQFEVNLQTTELKQLLDQCFLGWKILKSTVQRQYYDIPRDNGTCVLQTDVVTFAAKK